MARQLREQSRAARSRGLRAEVVAALQARADKLPAVDEFYDFGPQRAQLADRIAELAAGVDAQVQSYELPAELRSQYADAKLFRLVGNRLVPEQPERD